MNPKKLWVKGNQRKMLGDTLKNQAKRCVEIVNGGLGEGERKFECGVNPAIYGWDLKTAASMVFESEGEALRFYASSRHLDMEYDDGAHGKYAMRVSKDTAFDKRLRGQVCWHLKQETKKVLSECPRWKELGEDISVQDGGPRGTRGVVFINASGELYEVFHVDVSKSGDLNVARPVYEIGRAHV